MELKTPFDYLPDPSGDSYFRRIFDIPDGMNDGEFVTKFGYDEDGNPRNYEDMKEAVDEYNARECAARIFCKNLDRLLGR
jgi:2-succinyl-6-hydroxy-2,4-cyclohexadiene-1-carboxylate synthase